MATRRGTPTRTVTTKTAEGIVEEWYYAAGSPVESSVLLVFRSGILAAIRESR